MSEAVNTMPKPLSLEEYVKNVTSFFVDDQLEEEFDQMVTKGVRSFKKDLLGITTKEGLINYIRAYDDAIDNLISLLNISEEKFKRIVTMLRIRRGYMPQGDWSPKTVRSNMTRDPAWMEEICDLLMNGARSEKYKSLIPRFYARSFSIDTTTLGRLGNEDDIRRLIMKSLSGKYSNRIGDRFFGKVFSRVKQKCGRLGLEVVAKTVVPALKQRMDIVIPSVQAPRIVIHLIYTITTSSIQTDYAKKTERIRQAIRKVNDSLPDKSQILYVNIVDGGGWVARQSDLNRILGSSDYLLNLKTLDRLDEIIEHYFN